MNRPASWFAPSLAPLAHSPPLHVESLARAVMQREQLSPRDLPRCRHEVRLQLRFSRLPASRERPSAATLTDGNFVTPPALQESA